MQSSWPWAEYAAVVKEVYVTGKASGGAPGIRNNGIISDGSYRNYNSRGVFAWTLPLQGQWEQCLVSLGCGQMVGNPYVTFGAYFDGAYHYAFNHK